MEDPYQSEVRLVNVIQKFHRECFPHDNLPGHIFLAKWGSSFETGEYIGSDHWAAKIPGVLVEGRFWTFFFCHHFVQNFIRRYFIAQAPFEFVRFACAMSWVFASPRL